MPETYSFVRQDEMLLAVSLAPLFHYGVSKTKPTCLSYDDMPRAHVSTQVWSILFFYDSFYCIIHPFFISKRRLWELIDQNVNQVHELS